MQNPFIKPVSCTFARQCTFADTKETKRFNDRTFVAMSETDARKLVDQWNKSSDDWKYWVISVSPCPLLPEGDWLEEVGVKYQFAKEAS